MSHCAMLHKYMFSKGRKGYQRDRSETAGAVTCFHIL